MQCLWGCRVQGGGWGWMQGTVVAIENTAARLYGLQYHPEVQHSERGIATLRRFLFDISKVPADWKIENVLEEEMAKIRATVRPCLLPRHPAGVPETLHGVPHFF